MSTPASYDSHAGDAPPYAVVIPTVGRPCLAECLRALAAATGPRPAAIVVVDDRRPPGDGRGGSRAALGHRARELARAGHRFGFRFGFRFPGGGRSSAVAGRPRDGDWHRDRDRDRDRTVRAGGGQPVVGDDLPLHTAGALRERILILRTGGHGPAAARNAGLRAVEAPWVVFLDDDVRVGTDWGQRLAADLTAADASTGGVQGRLRVPLPPGRRPTDWERGTAGLEHAAWATADMAYRAAALRDVGGFDERFPRAFREDADLALRVMDAGWTLDRGARVTLHPVRPADRWVSVRVQRGNADDALMNRLHGPGWWSRARAPRGRLPRHAVITAAALAAPVLALTGRPRAARAAAALWALGTAEFAWARVAPGPRTPEEVTTMLVTSLAIPPAAVTHHLTGLVQHRTATPWRGLL